MFKRNVKPLAPASGMAEPASTSDLRPLSRREMKAMLGGVSRAEYCGTLEMTYNASSLQKANAEYGIYKAAWDTHCAPYNM